MNDYKYENIIKKAKEIVNSHIVREKETGEFLYTCPNHKNYPHQWLWDSSFHSIIWSYLDIDKAKKELLTVVKKQYDNGMLPHMSYWRKAPSLLGKISDWFFANKEGDRSHITQPPVIAQAAEIVYNKSKDIDWLKKIIVPLIDYFNWLDSDRDYDNDGLVSIIHPWESGMDMLPCWDVYFKAKRVKTIRAGLWLNRLLKKYKKVNWNMGKIIELDKFLVKDVSFNVIYILGLQSLSKLCAVLKKDEEKIYLDRANRGIKSLEDKCWDSNTAFYFDLYSTEDIKIEEFTVSGLFPIVLEVEKSRAKLLIENHILNEKEFWPAYPIPSVSIKSEKFNPKKSLLLWRGPTWVNTNWYLIKGLKKQGYQTEANELIDKSLKMVDKQGFWEYYNPLTGSGKGARNLTWSTIVIDMIYKLKE